MEQRSRALRKVRVLARPKKMAWRNIQVCMSRGMSVVAETRRSLQNLLVKLGDAHVNTDTPTLDGQEGNSHLQSEKYLPLKPRRYHPWAKGRLGNVGQNLVCASYANYWVSCDKHSQDTLN